MYKDYQNPLFSTQNKKEQISFSQRFIGKTALENNITPENICIGFGIFVLYSFL